MQNIQHEILKELTCCYLIYNYSDDERFGKAKINCLYFYFLVYLFFLSFSTLDNVPIK